LEDDEERMNEMLSVEDLAVIKEVGKASADAMLYAANLVKPGAKLLEVAESAERFLKERGFGLAFPINLSVNAEAAHYTPTFADERTFSDKDIVKVDFGAEKNGLLGDGAITVDLSGERGKMIEVADTALDNAIATVRHGVSVCDIGKAIADTIEAAGYLPIKNLGGHGVGRHDLHAEFFIPNYDNGDFTTLEEGMVIAIEPFLTLPSGKGMIVESDICEIYSYAGEVNVRSPEARALLAEILKSYSTEPFAVRWLSNLVNSKFRLYAAIAELFRAGALEASPTLIEASGKEVSQAEAQLLVTKDGCEIITRAKM